MVKRLIILLLFSGFIGQCFAAKIVASLLPIANIASGLALPSDTVSSLLPPGASPHGYHLKPSDLRKLTEADIIIWLGSDLENYLTGTIKKLKKTKTVINLAEAKDLEFLRESKSLPHPVGHMYHRLDPHIWLSSENAKVILKTIAPELYEIAPENQSNYQEKLRESLEKLTLLKKRLTELLQPVRDKPYLVFHDAYRYFEKEFKLNKVASVTFNPSQPISGKHLQELLTTVKRQQVECAFHEPQFEPRLIKRIEERIQIRVGELDPLGQESTISFDNYLLLLSTIGKNIAECLAG